MHGKALLPWQLLLLVISGQLGVQLPSAGLGIFDFMMLISHRVV